MALGTTLKQPETAQLVAMIRKAPCFATCGQKRPPFAAFAGLKSRAKVAILLLGQNIRSIFARTHTERVLRHDHKTKRCQAEAGSIRLSEVPSAMRRWPSTASTPNTSPLPNAGAYTQRVLFEQVTKGVVLGDEIALLRVLIRRSS